MIFQRYLVLLIALSTIFICIDANSKMYKWTDENGVVHFSDIPPLDNSKLEKTYETTSSPDISADEKRKQNSQTINNNHNKTANQKKSNEELIVGRWENEGLESGEPYRIIWVINSNGSFRGNASGKAGGKPFSWTYSGDWMIKGNNIELVYKFSSLPEPKPGTKDTDKILRVDESMLLLESSRDGSVTKYERK